LNKNTIEKTGIARLDALVAEAKEVEAELNRLDDTDAETALEKRLDEMKEQIDVLAKPEASERHIRFEDGGVGNAGKRFMVKPNPLEYDFETLALGRKLLAGRGEILPDNLEDRFQILASTIARRTMTTTSTGYGEELVDTVILPRLWEDIVLDNPVAGLFQMVDMVSKSVEVPILGDATFYKPAGEGQSVTATDLKTSPKPKLTACVLKAQVDVSDEEDQDAIIALLPAIRAKLIRNAKSTIDNVLLNGDTTTGATNINKYGSAVSGNEAYLLGFDGLIHYALIEMPSFCIFDLATIEAADFATFESMLGKYSLNPQSCAYIMDEWAYRKFKFLDAFTTVEKMGAKATYLTGQLGAVGNIPVVVSPEIAKSCASGYVDGVTPSNNSKGRALLVHRPSWIFGVRKNITVAAERSEAKGQTSLVASLRIAFQCIGDRASSQYSHVALGYNGTV
jgi:HK97 family phage major capsid protein